MVRQIDLTRILRAAAKAGVRVQVQIEAGRMIVTPIDASAAPSGNSFDGMFS
ncbi:hypothetical protein [Sphingomonas sp.]|uniref:hypothetical protein n=1 Tax=Sphingomonas sp. TaxID=28214 RepID=UPI0026119213|nr:hypothetical protein [Sphingomonas sp.]